ncbi:hypothetical protein [Nocardia sp. BMG111209]|uniref:hypothetical protein n=1 Tax=Nocardia sp. BMG111209 TaxID=1160137 RepID=UPI00038211F7|nr:hypothetical protein [Nocardia sp. BMG111209]
MSELPAADRFGEGRDDSPYWNESVWFSFSIPQRRLHGMIQYYFRPNMGMLNGGPVMWDPSGTSQWDCLYYNWSHLQAMPAGAQKFAMTARNSLTVEVLEPLTRYRIGYDKDDFRLELQWEAVGPMHELHTGDPGQQATAKFHMEQPGRMTGTAHRHGERFEIDCFSMRDTSYGARDYESLACGGYFWGIADGAAFHALCMGEGRTAKSVGGFLWRDGELGSLVDGGREILEYGRFGPSRVVFDGTDHLGRTVHATGVIDPGLVFTGYTDHTVVWSLSEWDVDGVTYWGDNQEFSPAERFRRLARGEITREA